MSINEFLKPADGEWPVSGRGRGRGGDRRGQGRGQGRGGRGEFRGEFLGGQRQAKDVPAPSFEDPHQFPVLGGVVKA